MIRVLVTGATGFVASHLIEALLAKGYAVRGTIRSPERGAALRRALCARSGGAVDLELVCLDLTDDAGWAAAMDGVRHVHHVASPTRPGRNADMIAAARDGTLRVLRAAGAAGVARVVMTSSIAAIDGGHGARGPEPFDERCWTNLGRGRPVGAYARSKTMAERAAWDWAAGSETGPVLITLNPAGILGPLLSADPAPSLDLVLGPLRNAWPAFPPLHFGLVDVRDVASAHVAAMDRDDVAGGRFVLCSDSLWLHQIGAILQRAYPERRMPDRTMPAWGARLVALVSPELRAFRPDLGRRRVYDASKAKSRLGLRFRPASESILASAETALRFGVA